jgi:cytoskeleton protein RodZ
LGIRTDHSQKRPFAQLLSVCPALSKRPSFDFSPSRGYIGSAYHEDEDQPHMSELGRRLAEARTAKGLTLADVESITRIRQKWLEALENGEYSRLPRGATARGFLRTYAAYLGLDVQAVLNLYTDESGDEGDGVFVAEPGKPRLIDYRPLEVELIDSQPDNRWVPWVVALVVVAALAAGAWWFLSRNPGWNPLAALAPPPPATATATRTATPWIVTATPQPTVSLPQPGPTIAGEVVIPAATSDILPLPTPTVPATPQPTSRPTATPEVVGSAIMAKLRALQRAWVRVLVDGEVAEEGFLNPDDVRAWEASQSILIRTGNGGGVDLTLNGEDLGPMGNVGQVVERSWVVGDTGELIEGGSVTPAPPAEPTATPSPAG